MARLYLYARGSRPTWYIGGFPTGKKQRSTGFAGAAAKGKAEKLRVLEQKNLDAQAARSGPLGPLTVERWAAMWLTILRAPGESPYAEYESKLNNHILPIIGRLELADVTHEHVIEVLQAVRSKAPRTRRNIYRTLKQMLGRAVPSYIPINPCLLVESEHKKYLPPNEDASEWRAGAVFTRAEVEVLIFDARIPEKRRVHYALLFLLGTRSSEICALKLGAYRPDTTPLGKMVIAYSYNFERRIIKKTKTGVTREVPVHPMLAEILGPWLEPGGGREQMVAASSSPDQGFILPASNGGPRNRHTALKAIKRDLAVVGLRDRRVHDTRRSFISLGMDNGGLLHLRKWITHGRPKSGDAFDQYREPAWGALCSEVLRLEVSRPQPDAEVLPLRKYANSHSDDLQATYMGEKPAEESMVTPRISSSPRSGSGPGQPRKDGDTAGRPNETAAFDAGDLGQGGAEGPHVCQAVSESRKALTALERGDVDAAKAILTKLVRR